jgi:hypothetical protein
MHPLLLSLQVERQVERASTSLPLSLSRYRRTYLHAWYAMLAVVLQVPTPQDDEYDVPGLVVLMELSIYPRGTTWRRG